MNNNILEEAYFHIHNGEFTIRFEEKKKAYSSHKEDRIRNMIIDLENFGKHLSVIIPISKLNWDWLKEVFNRVSPPKENHYEPEKPPVITYKDGKQIKESFSLGHLCI